MDFKSNPLSLEQEFMHEVFVSKIQDLSYEETQQLLVKFHKQMLFKDNFYRQQFQKQKAKLARFQERH